MSSIVRIIFALLVICLPATVVAQATPGLEQFPREQTQSVSMMLSGYHALAARSDFERIPNARSIVEAIARGPHGVVRDRALAALGQYWPSGDVYLLLANVIASNDTQEGSRHRAVLVLAHAFGDRAIPAIRPLLASNDLQLQITAVQALGQIGTDEAVAIVNDFAPNATNVVLLEQIEKSTRVVR